MERGEKTKGVIQLEISEKSLPIEEEGRVRQRRECEQQREPPWRLRLRTEEGHRSKREHMSHLSRPLRP